ncbi:MAG TPA: zinc ribbon domain-containing protein [Archangium sp.]|uniref:zinc ribbon domain-containing protein n=1 Tax=Archangium sp. TaxID=1872627 RepID=UPI002E348C82|nr:zinc ribbon domain-containing protein [Archangium sp.]HEX5752891.1 zinc ribbon domain-containing protein [Archangium sp.]
MSATVVAGCARCGSALEQGDLRCPICALSVDEQSAGGMQLQKVQAKVVRCVNCGASLEYSAELKAPRCAFCASVMKVETTADPLEQAESFLPFTVDDAAAREALGRFLAEKRFFRPGDLAAAAALQSLRPMWWPAWGFTAGARVSWAADSDAGSRRSAWAPHSGQETMSFQNILVSASKGLSERECDKLAAHYRLGSEERAPRGPEDAQVERFDVTRSGARKQILAAVESLAREEMEREHVPGSRVRNLHVAVVLSSLETKRYALPAYVLAYQYKGKVYRVVVHGQDANVVLGDAPLSWAKVLLVVGGVLLALVLLALMFSR